jgi:hypothetical protein
MIIFFSFDELKIIKVFIFTIKSPLKDLLRKIGRKRLIRNTLDKVKNRKKEVGGRKK